MPAGPLRILAVLAFGLLLGGGPLEPLAAAASGTLPSTMRRVVLERESAGGYHWSLTQGAVPHPGDHQVLVHVRAVALNRGDLEILEPGSTRDLTGLQVASDAAGEVVAVGSLVRDVREGMRVTSTYFRNWVDGPANADRLATAYGFQTDGVLADYVALDDSSVVPIAPGLSDAEAATLPTAGLTGWMATAGRQPVAAGSQVLIQGTGGVSIFALQFAVASGAHVILTSSSDEKLQQGRALGAVAGINYRSTPDWAPRVRELTHGHGADLVVDVGGKATLARSADSLAYGGTLSIVGGLTGYGGEIPARPILNRVARAQGVYVGSRADFIRMNAFIAAHHLHPVIDHVYPLAQYAEALKQMASDRFVGKIVLTLD